MKFITSALSRNSTIPQSNLDEGSLDLNSLEESSIDDNVERLVPVSINNCEAKRRKITSSNSSTSQTDLRARIDECKSEIVLTRCVLNDEDKILSNFVFSSLKTLKAEVTARLRQKNNTYFERNDCRNRNQRNYLIHFLINI